MAILKCVKFKDTKLKKLSSPDRSVSVQYTCTYLCKEKKKRQQVLRYYDISIASGLLQRQGLQCGRAGSIPAPL